MAGWIKLHRQIQDNPLYFSEPFTRSSAWIDLLLLANHKDAYFYKRGVKIDVKVGQVGYDIDSLSKRWRWSRGKAERFLKTLENESQIIRQKNNVTTLISIVNYNEYQSDGKASSKANGKANGQQTVKQTDTNKNDNNDNNDNKHIEQTQKFLKWFNQKIYQHKNVLGKFSSLTKTDLNNLKKLQDDGYTPDDFDHAFNVMYFSEWVKDNNMATPSHYLRNDNFQKYLNTQLKSKKEVVDLDTDLANYVKAQAAKYRTL